MTAGFLISIVACNLTILLAFAQDIFLQSKAEDQKSPYLVAFLPRDVKVVDGQFVNQSGAREHMRGTNIVVKGPPWIPSVEGTTRCNDDGICKTFNEQDVMYFKTMGFNLIRLGVVWAGGQPTSMPVLDKDFVGRLHALLELCHTHGIRVILDVHQDALGTAMCGEGLPVWYIKEHLPHLIGKPIVGIKSKLTGKCSVTDLKSWAIDAGDPDYNIKNECCVAVNSPGPWGVQTLPTVGVQLAFAQLVSSDAGRKAYATYIGLLAQAVAQYPAAIGIELMNEPPFASQVPLETRWLYSLYKECYDAVRAVSEELAVGIVDEGSIAKYADDNHLPSNIRSFLRNDATHLFYAFHWYSGGTFPSLNNSIANAKVLARYGAQCL